MTELEWEECDDPARMLNALRGIELDRKLRLAAVAAVRQEVVAHGGELAHWALEFAESAAEGDVNRFTLEVARERVSSWSLPLPSDSASIVVARAAGLCLGTSAQNALVAITAAMPHLEVFLRKCVTDGEDDLANARVRCKARMAAYLREVVGNPFRSVGIQRGWRTGTATTLARQMYDSREFSAMPILADALQDAGCENAELLNHCRDPHATHVRGCWVCDLVLGKA